MQGDRNDQYARQRSVGVYRYAELPWKRMPAWLEEFRLQSDTELDSKTVSKAQPKSGAEEGWGRRSAGREHPADADLQAYRYEPAPGFPVEEDLPGDFSGSDGNQGDEEKAGASSQTERPNDELIQQLLATETARGEERGIAKGMEMGMALGREESARKFEAERDRLRLQAEGLVKSFAETQGTYLHRLEQEAAKLALAIAARILRREAQLDALLLTGAVRVALGQLASSTEVRLRVPEQDEPMWREAVERMPGLALRPQVVGEPEMELGECRMETELGTADLGLWAQLKTVERGFFERPGGLTGTGEGDARAGQATA